MNKLIYGITVLVGLFLVSTLIALFIQEPGFSLPDFTGEKSINIAVIPINGVISSDESSSISSIINLQKTSPATIQKYIDNVKADSSINAVIFDVNSPGGAVVPSDEISKMIKSLNKTRYAVISDLGASGAYWAVSSCDKIIASPMSVTGSIGVTSSYLDFSGLFEKYGVSYNSLTAGSLKEIGSPYKNLTAEERKILEDKLKIIQDYFVKSVAENRKIPEENVRDIATGEFFLGVEAKNLGLVDELGDRDTAISLLKKQFNATSVKIIEFKEQESFLTSLAKISAYEAGRGISAGLLENSVKAESNVDIKT